MTLEPRIRRLWSWYPAAATTLGTTNTVWIDPRYSGAQRFRLIAHEKVHLRQAREGGWRFRLRYAFSRKWRTEYEAEAYAESVRLGADKTQCALHLSSWLYLRCCTYTEASEAIDRYLMRGTT